MDIQQAKILLEKINALQKNINHDGGDLARIERDLMLSYIRQLYETYLEADVPTVVARSAPKTYSTPTPPPVATPEPRAAAPIQAPPPPPPPAPEPEPVAVEAPPTPPTPKPSPAPEPIPVVAQKAPPLAAPAPSVERSSSPGIESLFRIKMAKELSEKLGQQEIKDLTKALSINDKLLYANELFGRDMTVMTQTLQQLNGLTNMAEAKTALIPTAEKFDWAEEERADVAQSFIRLVSRKY